MSNAMVIMATVASDGIAIAVNVLFIGILKLTDSVSKGFGFKNGLLKAIRFVN
jgi:hypothetical protein